MWERSRGTRWPCSDGDGWHDMLATHGSRCPYNHFYLTAGCCYECSEIHYNGPSRWLHKVFFLELSQIFFQLTNWTLFPLHQSPWINSSIHQFHPRLEKRHCGRIYDEWQTWGVGTTSTSNRSRKPEATVHYLIWVRLPWTRSSVHLYKLKQTR